MVSVSQSKEVSIQYADGSDHEMISEAAGMVSARCTLNEVLADISEDDLKAAYLSTSRMSITHLLNPEGLLSGF